MTFLSYVQGELKFIINLVPVLIFLELLVNFYLSVAEQVTFVSQNYSVNLPRLEELEGLVYICGCEMKDRNQEAVPSLQKVGFFVFLCI